MPTTFFFAQYVNFAFEISVRSDRTWFANNHTTTDLGFFNTTKQQPCIITSFALIKQLAEHFHTSYRRSQRSWYQSYYLNAFTHFNTTSFNTASSNSTTTSEREYVLNRHQERLINRPRRKWNIAINCGHQLINRSQPFFFTSQRASCRTFNNRRIITIKTVESKQSQS